MTPCDVADGLPPEPVPPGVKGYVVARISGGAVLTHASLMDREQAGREAAQWREADRTGPRYVVCEVREAP